MKTPDSFVPLTAAPASSAPREFRVSVLNGHNHNHSPANGNGNGNGNGSSNGHSNGNGNGSGSAPKSTGFQALETQRPASVENLGGTAKKIGEPRVTVQRDGDRITHLRIQCGCGQIIDLACAYDAPKAA